MKESVAAPHKMLQQTRTTAIDLDAYLQRIGYSGERTRTLDTLRIIQLRIPIAFENLNPLMKWPIQLDIESLQQKLLRDGAAAIASSRTCCSATC